MPNKAEKEALFIRRHFDAHATLPSNASAVARDIEDFYDDATIETEDIITRVKPEDETDECYFFEAVISSSEPVTRYQFCDGEWTEFKEILEHDSLDNIDLTRFDKGQLQLLERHYGDVMGKIESIRVDKGKAYARIKMMKTGKSGEISDKWRNDIGCGLSIGYSPIVRETDKKKKEIRIREWLLYEVSTVGIPADLEAGVGRRSLERKPPAKKEGKNEDKREQDEDPDDENRVDNPANNDNNENNGDNNSNSKGERQMPEAVKKDDEDQPKINYSEGFDEIRGWADTHSAKNDNWKTDEGKAAMLEAQREAEREFQTSGNLETALGKFNGRALDYLASVENSGVKKVDVDPEEARASYQRTRSLGPVNYRKIVDEANWDKAADNDNLNMDTLIAVARGESWAKDSISGGVLREYKEEAIKAGLRNQSETPGEAMPVPPEMIADYNLRQHLATLPISERLALMQTARGMSITGDAGGKGGKTLQTDVLLPLFVDFLYAEANFNALGATSLMNLTGNVLIPRQTGAVTAYSLAETAELAASDFTIGSFSMSPKRMAVKIPFSRQSTLQTPGNFMENLVGDQLMKAMMNHKQNMLINGTGTNNQPLGVMNTSGLGLISHGTNGGAPTYSKTLEVIKELLEAETYTGTIRCLTTPGIWHKRMTTVRFGSSDSMTIWNDRHLNSPDIQMTNLLSTTATKGTGTALHHEIWADWREFLIGEWGNNHIIIDPYSKKESSQIEIMLECFIDCAARRTASFVASKDVDVA